VIGCSSLFTGLLQPFNHSATGGQCGKREQRSLILSALDINLEISPNPHLVSYSSCCCCCCCCAAAVAAPALARTGRLCHSCQSDRVWVGSSFAARHHPFLIDIFSIAAERACSLLSLRPWGERLALSRLVSIEW
jgi:hypothetical protein